MISPVSFDNQGMLVVGGTQGIAPAIILLAAQRKASVVFTAPRGCEPAADQLVAAAQAAGMSDRVSCLITELADEEEVEQFVDAALERLPSLDVLIHNLEPAAAIEHKPLIDISLAEWNRVLSSELRIPFVLARRVVEEYLVSRVNGRIAYIAYSGSEGGTAHAGYAAAQSGLRALIRCVTKEFGRREVACNGVIINRDGGVAFPSPAQLLSDRSAPQHPAAAPNELLETLLFFVSREASFVNGEFINISSPRRESPFSDPEGSKAHVKG